MDPQRLDPELLGNGRVTSMPSKKSRIASL